MRGQSVEEVAALDDSWPTLMDGRDAGKTGESPDAGKTCQELSYRSSLVAGVRYRAEGTLETLCVVCPEHSLFTSHHESNLNGPKL